MWTTELICFYTRREEEGMFLIAFGLWAVSFPPQLMHSRFISLLPNDTISNTIQLHLIHLTETA